MRFESSRPISTRTGWTGPASITVKLSPSTKTEKKRVRETERLVFRRTRQRRRRGPLQCCLSCPPKSRKRKITGTRGELSPCHSGCRGPLPRALATKSVPEDCARGDEEVTHASTSDGVRREPLPGRRGRRTRVPNMLRRPRGPRPAYEDLQVSNVLQAPVCEHAFCRSCINEWINRQPTCPLDRTPITSAQLRAVPRILRNLLARLCINCDNIVYGCNAIVKLDSLTSHLEQCEYNPKRPMLCEQGCSLIIPKNELKDHNCVRELRNLIQSQQQKLADMKRELGEQQLQINEHKREIHLLKDFMRALRVSNPAMRAIADQMERDEVVRWSATLPRARVTRWGGMISTPDELLQTMIKRTLSEYNCPPHVIDELMENCHERKWPPGLNSLETRQNSRRQYDNYVCKRVPGKQAVLVLHCDNTHMPEDMMVEPGLVMIFAHGIE